MVSNLARNFQTLMTPQSEPMPLKAQIPNHAGGFVFELDEWKRLDRFLILGSDGGTYYVSERRLTIENAKNVLACIKSDGLRVVNRTVEISDSGRAPKNDPALFVLALAASHGSDATRTAALNAIPKVARTASHLFVFAEMIKGFRGWGRGLRRGIGAWYSTKTPEQLALQLTKYPARGAWSNKDLLRLSDAKAPTAAHAALYRFAVTEGNSLGARDVSRGASKDSAVTKHYDAVDTTALPKLIADYEALKRAQMHAEVVSLIAENSAITWEMIPDRFLGEPAIWEALLPHLPMNALVKNLARMTANGLIAPLSDAARVITERLSDAGRLKKARVHPILLLSELIAYKAGTRTRGKLSWTPVTQVIDALDEAFYRSFGNVTPTNKRILKALDVSGSMTDGAVCGVAGLTPRVATAALALVSARVEPAHSVMAFSNEFVPLDISPRERLDDVVAKTDDLPFGGTDCSLPIVYALEHSLEVDLFEIYTDNETWHGHIHPAQALAKYRRETGIPAKLVVVGMTATEVSIADPDDAGMLDVVGFDTATPEVISDFARG